MGKKTTKHTSQKTIRVPAYLQSGCSQSLISQSPAVASTRGLSCLWSPSKTKFSTPMPDTRERRVFLLCVYCLLFVSFFIFFFSFFLYFFLYLLISFFLSFFIFFVSFFSFFLCLFLSLFLSFLSFFVYVFLYFFLSFFLCLFLYFFISFFLSFCVCVILCVCVLSFLRRFRGSIPSPYCTVLFKDMFFTPIVLMHV